VTSATVIFCEVATNRTFALSSYGHGGIALAKFDIWSWLEFASTSITDIDPFRIQFSSEAIILRGSFRLYKYLSAYPIFTNIRDHLHSDLGCPNIQRDYRKKNSPCTCWIDRKASRISFFS
jgi:hypothetical protein